MDYDEKRGLDLLQLLNDVITGLDERHKRDVRDDSIDATVSRMLQLLRILNYPIGDSELCVAGSRSLPPSRSTPCRRAPASERFQARLQDADKGLVTNVLAWILSKFPMLKKRAYVARFLAPVPIPQEFLHDEGAPQDGGRVACRSATRIPLVTRPRAAQP